MKNINFLLLGLLTTLLFFSSCEIETVENPNGPTLESLENGATEADILLLINGVEASMRSEMQFYYWTVSIVGREYYDLRGTDPRYTGELLGAEGAALDNNGFLTTRPFSGAYYTVRQAQVLLNALENTTASFTAEHLNGIRGFAKTVQAYRLLLCLNHQYQNGIRVDVEDPDNLGGFLSYDASLAGIKSLLDDANDNLNSAGGAFPFALSTGFQEFGFGNPQTFKRLNRAIAARVTLYQGDMAATRSVLAESFFDIGGSLKVGAYHAFSTGGNDTRNLLFNVPNADLYTVTPSWLADAEPGDSRVTDKSAPLDEAASLDGLTGTDQVTMFDSDIDPFPIIRQEELLLIYAEANVGVDNDGALTAINNIRMEADLTPIDGPLTDSELVDQIIHERRYSLFGEGHRWIDMRRWGRLDEIELDRASDVIHVQFPRPVSEGG